MECCQQFTEFEATKHLVVETYPGCIVQGNLSSGASTVIQIGCERVAECRHQWPRLIEVEERSLRREVSIGHVGDYLVYQIHQLVSDLPTSIQGFIRGGRFNTGNNVIQSCVLCWMSNPLLHRDTSICDDTVTRQKR
jgi:hypothetical protein